MIVETVCGPVNTSLPIPAQYAPYLAVELEDQYGKPVAAQWMSKLMEENEIGERDEAIRIAQRDPDMFNQWGTIVYDPDWEIREIMGNEYGLIEDQPYKRLLHPIASIL